MCALLCQLYLHLAELGSTNNFRAVSFYKHIMLLLNVFKFFFVLSALLALGLSVAVLFIHDNTKTGGIFTLVVRNVLPMLSFNTDYS
jgi:hypothetical protein